MNYILTNFHAVNEGEIFTGKIWIIDGRIDCIEKNGGQLVNTVHDYSSLSFQEINLEGNYLLPGVIDDQVHFRDPGLTHKGDIYSESRAAAAGGVTSFMDMPNTVPNAITTKILEEKYSAASEKSLINYSFFIGASNDNYKELMEVDPTEVCGIKLFLGSSTGNMLVDNSESLKNIFSQKNLLVAIHAEEESIVRANSAYYKEEFGENIPIAYHPKIRSEEACFRSSEKAVELASRYGTRLHILHLSTARELSLLRSDIPLNEKLITGEVCVHHLWFSEKDYATKGNFIKWNPAIKTEEDRKALFQGIIDNTIDIIATDHAPHTFEEKQQSYFKAPSGGPLIQHSLTVMLEFFQDEKLKLEKIVEKMCHHPAELYRIKDRGYIREGYWADLCVVNLNHSWQVNKSNILYKCGWSPFDGETFRSSVTHTFVNGCLVFENGRMHDENKGKRLSFYTNEK